MAGCFGLAAAGKRGRGRPGRRPGARRAPAAPAPRQLRALARAAELRPLSGRLGKESSPGGGGARGGRLGAPPAPPAAAARRGRRSLAASAAPTQGQVFRGRARPRDRSWTHAASACGTPRKNVALVQNSRRTSVEWSFFAGCPLPFVDCYLQVEGVERRSPTTFCKKCQVSESRAKFVKIGDSVPYKGLLSPRNENCQKIMFCSDAHVTFVR